MNLLTVIAICHARLDDGTCPHPSIILSRYCTCTGTQLFGRQCIRYWLLGGENRTCPLCRGKVMALQDDPNIGGGRILAPHVNPNTGRYEGEALEPAGITHHYRDEIVGWQQAARDGTLFAVESDENDRDSLNQGEDLSDSDTNDGEDFNDGDSPSIIEEDLDVRESTEIEDVDGGHAPQDERDPD